MKSAKEIGHIFINLYRKTFGGNPDDFEVLDGPGGDYIFRRKEDGLITVIQCECIELYLSDNQADRDKGRSKIMETFLSFELPVKPDRVLNRYRYDSPDLVSVRVTIEKGEEGQRSRILNVVDSSKTGIAFLVTEKDSDLLDLLKEGDLIRDMEFFGIGARIKEDGIVRHISEIQEGEFQGCHILGVEAADL